MPSDDLTWDVLRKNCAHKANGDSKSVVLCRNGNNPKGRCSRRLCPLQNPRHATVVEREGRLFLRVSTPERVHQPSKWSQEYALSPNVPTALAQIETNLQWFPKGMVTSCKEHMLRMTAVHAQMRRLASNPGPSLVRINKKEDRAMSAKEGKAERAAKLETNIEKELLTRLQTGIYDSEITVPEECFMALIDKELDREDTQQKRRLPKASRAPAMTGSPNAKATINPELEVARPTITVQPTPAMTPVSKGSVRNRSSSQSEPGSKRQRKAPAPKPVLEVNYEKELLHHLLDW